MSKSLSRGCCHQVDEQLPMKIIVLGVPNHSDEFRPNLKLFKPSITTMNGKPGKLRLIWIKLIKNNK